MFGSTSRGTKIDSGGLELILSSDMSGCCPVELILPPELILLEVRICSF